MDDVGCPGRIAKRYENTTRTSEDETRLVAPVDRPSSPATTRAATCVYVAAAAWRYGAGDPFCGAPSLPGSPYCAPHHALCALVAGSAEAAGAARAQSDPEGEAPPPPSLIRSELPLPLELDAEEDPRELAACLDLPVRAAAAEEG